MKRLFVIPILMTMVTLATAIALTTTKVSAGDTIQSNVDLSVPLSCNLSGSIDSPHTATINPGTYQTDIGTTTITTFCNDSAGYSIYAIGYSNEEYGNTKLLATIGGTLSPSNDINTSTATSGTTSAWAMKLTPVTTQSSGTTQPYAPTIVGGYDSYSSVPANYTKVATFTSTTDFTIGSSLETTYAAYVDGLKPAGTYTGKVKYTMVHPNDAAAPTIPPTPPVSCPTPVPNVTYMQDITSSNKSSVLTSMTEDAQYYLADKRDNKAYCVAKLKDGNIWMTQNLDFDIGSTTLTHNSTTLYHDDTDLGYGNSSNQSWTPDKATYTTSTTTWATASAGNDIQQSYDPGNKIWDGVPDSNGETTLDNMTQGTNTHYHLGNYYNFGAAVAMNDTSSLTTQYTDVDQSICPANWTLPKSGNNTSVGSFQYLLTQYGYSSNSMTNPYMWESPFYFTLGGFWYGSPYHVASDGVFWSPVVYSSSGAYSLFGYDTGYVDPSSYNANDYGISVRCIAR